MPLTPNQLSTSKARRDKLVKICTALPELTIEPAGAHLAFRLRKKTLAYYQFDHHGDGMISLVCKSSLNEQRRLVRDDPEMFFVPDYLGTKGWIGLRLDLDRVEWDTVSELLKRAYQDLAPRKLAAMLERE